MKSTQAFISQAIRVQRVRAGISSEAELARRAGMSPSALSKRLNGDLRMDLGDIDQIASALEIDPFALMDLAQSEQAVAA